MNKAPATSKDREDGLQVGAKSREDSLQVAGRIAYRSLFGREDSLQVRGVGREDSLRVGQKAGRIAYGSGKKQGG